MVSLVFFDSEQLLIHKQTPKNASKYPKLACAKIAILHLAASRGLKGTVHVMAITPNSGSLGHF